VPPPKDHHVTIHKKRWTIRFTKLRGGAAGWCDWDKRLIHIDSRLKGQAKVDTIVHEIVHATMGEHASEECVTEAGRVAASVIHRILKYREQANG
jgi:hypothetical protein